MYTRATGSYTQIFSRTALWAGKFSKIFARCARRQIFIRIFQNPRLGQKMSRACAAHNSTFVTTVRLPLDTTDARHHGDHLYSKDRPLNRKRSPVASARRSLCMKWTGAIAEPFKECTTEFRGGLDTSAAGANGVLQAAVGVICAITPTR